MKIAITGGAGYLGLYAANYFLKKGHKINILDICDYSKDDYVGSVGYFKGDVRNYRLVHKALRDTDFIIHAAAELPFKRKQDIFSVTVNGMENVLKAAKENNVKQVVFISSTAVYGIRENMPIYEDSGYSGVTSHARSKILAEQLCDIYRASGQSIAILRPAPLIGAGRLGIFQIFYDWISENRKIPIIGRGENRFQLLETEDLCDSINLIMASSAQLANDNFNIGADVFATINEDISNFIREVNSKSKLIHFPKYISKIVLKMCEKMRVSPVYEGAYGIIDKDLYFSTEKIHNMLGWSSKSSNVDALVKAYRWYLDNRNNIASSFKNINNRSVFKQGVISVVKKIF